MADDPATTVDEAAPHEFVVSVPVHDSRGTDHSMTVVMRPVDSSGDGNVDGWSYEARIRQDQTTAPVDPAHPDYHVVGTGTLTFDGNGQLTGPATNPTFTMPAWTSGAGGQDVEWRIYDANNEPVVTSYAASSALDSLNNDGYGLGRLNSVSVGSDGLVMGVFSNGEALELAQLTLASFNNPDGLIRRGDNTYLTSVGSGPATLGTAESGGRGAVIAKALELSNVDITEQFTSMIVAERGYQSNSRIITTADEMIQETLSIKR